jgi:hypothetical protein
MSEDMNQSQQFNSAPTVNQELMDRQIEESSNPLQYENIPTNMNVLPYLRDDRDQPPPKCKNRGFFRCLINDNLMQDYQFRLDYIYLLLFVLASVPIIGFIPNLIIIFRGLRDGRTFLAIITALTTIISLLEGHIIDLGFAFKIIYFLDVYTVINYARDYAPGYLGEITNTRKGFIRKLFDRYGKIVSGMILFTLLTGYEYAKNYYNSRNENVYEYNLDNNNFEGIQQPEPNYQDDYFNYLENTNRPPSYDSINEYTQNRNVNNNQEEIPEYVPTNNNNTNVIEQQTQKILNEHEKDKQNYDNALETDKNKQLTSFKNKLKNKIKSKSKKQ